MKVIFGATNNILRVLIICNDFPPLNSVGALRPFSWYKWFKEFDAEPIIITKQWKENIELPSDVMKASDSTNVVIEKNDYGIVYRLPVTLIPSEKMYVRFGENKFRIFRRLLTMIYKMMSFVFFSFDKHKQIYEQARKIIRTEKIDVVLISGEPFILFKYGYLLKKEFEIKWVADYRDAWYMNHVTSLKKDLVNRFMIWYEYQFEKKYIKNCDLIITPDPQRKELLTGLHKKKCEIIYNGFEKFLPENSTVHSETDKTLTLTHTGTLTIGQRVEFILQAIVELKNENKIQKGDILLQFIGLEYFNAQLNRVLNFNKDIADFIKTTARLPREKALTINQSSDFLIAFTEENNQTLFAKVYDYIASRRTILVIPGDNGLVSEIVKQTNSGISFNSISDLKKFLLEQIVNKKTGEKTLSFSVDEEKALFYTRKNQSKRLVNFLKQLINSTD